MTDCCERWAEIREILYWFQFDDEPQKLAMPCLDGTHPGAIRVNYCPSCGAKVRSYVWDTSK